MPQESRPVRQAEGEIAPAAIQDQADRILASSLFLSAPSLSRFLRHLVEATIRDGGVQLKEYSLGVDVFDRGESFDPRIDTIVRAQARRLRGKLEQYYRDEGAGDSIVIELPKGGYAARFGRAAASPVSGSDAGDSASVGQPLDRPLLAGVLGKRLLWLAGLVAVTGVFGFLAMERPRGAAPPSLQLKAVAVLPFADETSEPLDDYVVRGMTLRLAGELAKLDSLRVIAPSAVERFEGSLQPPAEIARELGADALLRFALSRSGDRMHLTARLYRADLGDRTWSQRFEKDANDVMTLEREAAIGIATQLLSAPPPVESSREVHPGAYDAYLRGLFQARKENRSDNAKAIALFEDAVAADPSFAAAHAELARVSAKRFFLLAPDEAQWEEKAFTSIEKALALEPDLAAAHAALGMLLWTPSNRFPHDRAIREYRRAIETNPSLGEAHHMLSLIYSHVGLLDEALMEVEEELAINPTSWARLRTGQTLLYQEKAEEALAVLEGIPTEINPPIVGFHVGWALLKLGRLEAAAAKSEELLASYPEDPGGVLAALRAMTFAASGDAGAAETQIRIALKRGRNYGHFHHTAYGVGSAYALMHRPDEAIRWLAEAADTGFACYPLFASDRNLDPVRDAPGFIELLSRLREDWERRKAAFPV